MEQLWNRWSQQDRKQDSYGAQGIWVQRMLQGFLLSAQVLFFKSREPTVQLAGCDPVFLNRASAGQREGEDLPLLEAQHD